MQLDYAMQQKSGRSGRKFMFSKWSQDECVRKCVRKCVRTCVKKCVKKCVRSAWEVREILREILRERFEPLKNLLMQLFTQLLTHFVLLAAGRLGSRWNLSENPGTCGSSWNLFAPSENPCRLQALVVLKLPGISLKTLGSCGKLLEPSGTFRLGVPISTQYEGAAQE